MELEDNWNLRAKVHVEAELSDVDEISERN